ncbi:hypothetical protein DGG96_12665 [Legionella qingyii]|uniref:DUF5638 domain-containing protein n=1 Tax=Legionella qingyii TaxID=2184757 RepID=A0A317TZX7_9GAMM|nr:DUF5638 domain-containing protein [Legionella qingyii]PWY55314.1 hypothetical protein DGG96_12665 [Legionella qingyii]RUR22765.1 hypothetical protein ELY20_08575 [Legionella qingyii]RUR23834.1 hypothetical protein ELY16_12605 [Legionella qingyii]
MTSSLEIRLQECDKKIDALYKGVALNEEIEKQLKTIKAYYHKLYIDAIDKQAEKESIKIYELLVTGLEGLKNGQLKSEDVLKELDEIKALRKSNIVLENILTSLELLCWATLSGIFFSYCVLLAPPLVAVNPFFALAILTIACMTAIYSTANFFNCIDEFKSCTHVEQEFKREKKLISFFKCTPPSESPSKEFELNEYSKEGQLQVLIN